MHHRIIYFIYNKSLTEECDKEESVAVMAATRTSCLKRTS